MTEGHSAKRTLVRGAAWTVGMRWSVRLLGLLNTIVMARILMPSEYGIVAMASVVVGIVQALFDFGASTALLRKPQLDRDDIDSAWTLRLIQGGVVFGLLVVLSPVATSYFGEPRVMAVLWALGGTVALASTANIGLTLAQKEYDFALEFRIQVIANVLRVAVTIAAGLLLGDYRALVVGIAAGQIVIVLLSYWMHPYRPRWNTARIGAIWAVTKWLMLSGIGSFILRRGDEVIAGRIVDTPQQFGEYSVGADLGQMPTSEVGPAMLRALLPLLSAMSGSVQQINAAVVKTAAAVNTVTLALGLGMAAVAESITVSVLGANWVHAAPFVAGFAIVGALQSLPGTLGTLLIMRGYTRQHSVTVWTEFMAFLLAALALVPSMGLLGLVWARGLGALLGAVTAALLARRYCAMRLRALAASLVRPVVGAMLMYALVRWVASMVDAPALQLALGIPAGATFYVAWCVLTWHLVGRPDGLEAMALTRIIRFVQARRAGPTR